MSCVPCELIILGTPLRDDEPLTETALATLKRAEMIIGESRRRVFPILKRAGSTTTRVHLLDNIKPAEWQELERDLRLLSSTGGTVALFSDTGMPILFDPGAEVLALCRRLGFRVRSVPGPTSWGSAAALSGFAPPFLVVGFPPRKDTEREEALRSLARQSAHLVLMDAPYRFGLLLKDCARALGGDREAFLAWQLASEAEELCLWGTLTSLARDAETRGLRKGEFVLIVRGKPVKS